MADNNRPTIKKASLALALACIIDWLLYSIYNWNGSDNPNMRCTATHVLFTVRQELSFFWLQSFSQDRSRCIGDKYRQAP